MNYQRRTLLAFSEADPFSLTLAMQTQVRVVDYDIDRFKSQEHCANESCLGSLHSCP